MKTVIVEYEVFEYNELSHDAKNKAISEAIKYIMDHDFETIEKLWPDVAKAIEKAESMRTPWFASQYICDLCQDTLLAILNYENYLEDGSLWVEGD
jgi:hypothetical protein